MTDAFPPPPPPTSSTLPGPRAGFGERFIAWLIDVIIVGVVDAVLYRLLGGVGYGLSTIVSFAYYGFFEGGPAGQTIGKRVANIRVVRADGSGAELGWGTALIRHVCRIISAIPCALGYFWMLGDADKMTWHDKLSQTVVVPTSAYPVPADAFGKAPGSSPV
jgi:uncharacterized RDD family membrane protein YckC